MNRRGFLQSILAAGVAPAFVGSSVLMPVRKIVVPEWGVSNEFDALAKYLAAKRAEAAEARRLSGFAQSQLEAERAFDAEYVPLAMQLNVVTGIYEPRMFIRRSELIVQDCDWIRFPQTSA